MKPSLIVHGGAWDIPDEAVEACIIVLENAPVFDAGFGSHLNADGKVECDAIVMDGASLRSGAVAGLQRVKNPVRAARAVYEHCRHMMLIADGAEKFSKEHGVPLCQPEELVSEAE